jgi:hypothetical protein
MGFEGSHGMGRWKQRADGYKDKLFSRMAAGTALCVSEGCIHHPQVSCPIL